MSYCRLLTSLQISISTTGLYSFVDFDFFSFFSFFLSSFHSKFSLELHYARKGKGGGYRVFSHYGRTDDLEKNPDAGKKVRYILICILNFINCTQSINHIRSAAITVLRRRPLRDSVLFMRKRHQQRKATNPLLLFTPTLAQTSVNRNQRSFYFLHIFLLPFHTLLTFSFHPTGCRSFF